MENECRVSRTRLALFIAMVSIVAAAFIWLCIQLGCIFGITLIVIIYIGLIHAATCNNEKCGGD